MSVTCGVHAKECPPTMNSDQFEESLADLVSRQGTSYDHLLASGTNFVIYGTGSSGEQAFGYLRKHYPDLLVKYFVDSNIEKHGSRICGIEIESIEAISINDVILIASDYAIDIATLLNHRGLRNYYYFGFCDDFERWKRHFNYQYIADSRDSIVKAARLLEDDESRKIFYSILAFRCSCNPLKLQLSRHPEYLHPRVLPQANDLIVDGGGYTGDSAQLFFDFLGEQARIFSFECDSRNFEQLVKLSERYHEKLFPVFKALWNKKTTLLFSANSNHYESKIVSGTNDNATGIEAIALDGYFSDPINFIKLDVEGAEIQVIEGASLLLTSRREGLRLAISSYHLPDDLWQIPLRLKNLNPTLQIYLGHHSQKFMASVCYAALPSRVSR